MKNDTVLFHLSGKNQISGTIPSEIANIDGLEEFDMGKKNAQRMLSKYVQFNAVKTLTMKQTSFGISTGDNIITGGIPSEFGNLTSLKYMELGKWHI